MDPRHLHSWTKLGYFLQSSDNREPEQEFLGTDVILFLDRITSKSIISSVSSLKSHSISTVPMRMLGTKKMGMPGFAQVLHETR